jgi:hypothetical protein
MPVEAERDHQPRQAVGDPAHADIRMAPSSLRPHGRRKFDGHDVMPQLRQPSGIAAAAAGADVEHQGRNGRHQIGQPAMDTLGGQRLVARRQGGGALLVLTSRCAGRTRTAANGRAVRHYGRRAR